MLRTVHARPRPRPRRASTHAHVIGSMLTSTTVPSRALRRCGQAVLARGYSHGSVTPIDPSLNRTRDESIPLHLGSTPRFKRLRQRLLALETTVVCDADKVNDVAHPTGLATLQCIDSAIQLLNDDAGLKMVGVARTVSARDEEFLTVLHALCEAQPGEVLMIDGGKSRRAKCGEIFATAALQQGLAGIVVDGAARDSALVREMPLPYYVRSITPVAGSTGDAYGKCQEIVTIGNCTVSPGDVVFGDADGVLVGSMEAFEAVVDRAEAVAGVEERLSKHQASAVHS